MSCHWLGFGWNRATTPSSANHTLVNSESWHKSLQRSFHSHLSCLCQNLFSMQFVSLMSYFLSFRGFCALRSEVNPKETQPPCFLPILTYSFNAEGLRRTITNRVEAPPFSKKIFSKHCGTADSYKQSCSFTPSVFGRPHSVGVTSDTCAYLCHCRHYATAPVPRFLGSSRHAVLRSPQATPEPPVGISRQPLEKHVAVAAWPAPLET